VCDPSKLVCLFVVDLNFTILYDESRGSSVNIVSGYGLDDRAIEVRSPVEVRDFFL
jgi:hypothetical protein